MRRLVKEFLVSRSRSQKTFVMILSDLFAFNLFFLASFFLIPLFRNLNIDVSKSLPNLNIFFEIFSLNVFVLSFFPILTIYLLNGYKSFFRSVPAKSFIGFERFLGTLTYCVFTGLISFYISNDFFSSVRISFIQLVTIVFFFVFIRFAAYFFLSLQPSSKTPILIYGAGQAGRETAATLSQNEKYNILGFIDDDKKLKNFNILGLKVLGNINKILGIKNNYPSLLVILAMINISNKERKRIISLLEKYEVQVKTIPETYGDLEKKLTIKNLSINDLVERDEVENNLVDLENNFKNENILVTGGGGSIGSEIVKQLAKLNPNKIICLDTSEFNLYKISEETKTYKNWDSLVFILSDIRNISDIDNIVKKYSINNIFHCAAYKHVPILEEKNNFKAAIENNFIATFNLCKLCIENKIKKFTLISSDKAVNPPNLMGATKRLSELSLQAFQDKRNNSTIFSMVRFGNVLNSSGSVVPHFLKQIKNGGPLTVTHKDVNRFFMTIEEASLLVLQANNIAKGGEVFLLDMGNPIKIKELAEKMIRISGNSVAKQGENNGIEIIYTGLRPGEKLYEELLLDGDLRDTEHPKIKKANEKKFNYEEINNLKKELEENLTKQNLDIFKKSISNYVDGF